MSQIIDILNQNGLFLHKFKSNTYLSVNKPIWKCIHSHTFVIPFLENFKHKGRRKTYKFHHQAVKQLLSGKIWIFINNMYVSKMKRSTSHTQTKTPKRNMKTMTVLLCYFLMHYNLYNYSIQSVQDQLLLQVLQKVMPFYSCHAFQLKLNDPIILRRNSQNHKHYNRGSSINTNISITHFDNIGKRNDKIWQLHYIMNNHNIQYNRIKETYNRRYHESLLFSATGNTNTSNNGIDIDIQNQNLLSDNEINSLSQQQQSSQSSSTTTPKLFNTALLILCFGYAIYSIFTIDIGLTRGWSISEKAMRIPLDNWSSYESSLNNQPIFTKTTINVVIYLLGDWLSQTLFIKKNLLDFDAWRTMKNGFIGMIFGPIVHEYYEFSDYILPVDLNAYNRFKKIFMDQTIYIFTKCSIYIILVNLLGGESWEYSVEQSRGKIKNIMFTAWKFWPLVHCVTYTAIPARHRILWVNCVDLFWNAILASLAGNKKSDEVEIGDIDEIEYGMNSIVGDINEIEYGMSSIVGDVEGDFDSDFSREDMEEYMNDSVEQHILSTMDIGMNMDHDNNDNVVDDSNVGDVKKEMQLLEVSIAMETNDKLHQEQKE